MSEDIFICAAARTPLYLPVYVARARDFYGKVPREFSLRIEYPPKEATDADGWVHSQVAVAGFPFLFGVCDPFESYNENVSEIIAAIVTKAAFWAIDTDTPATVLADAHKFEKIVAFPEGMTGYLLYELTRQEGRKANQNWNPQYVRAEVGKELVLLQQDPSKTLAITPNLFEGQRLRKGGRFEVKIHYARQPKYGDFFTTALITRNDIAGLHELSGKGDALRAGLVEAIQLAIAEIRVGSEDAYLADVLLRELKEDVNEENRRIAREVISIMVNDGIFPAELTVSPSAWATSIYFHQRLHDPSTVEPSENLVNHSMQHDVNNEPAQKAFRKLVLGKAIGTPRPWRWGTGVAAVLVSFSGLLYFVHRLPWVLVPSLLILLAYVVCAMVLVISVVDHKSFGASKTWWEVFLAALIFLVGLVYTGAQFIPQDARLRSPFAKHWFTEVLAVWIIGATLLAWKARTIYDLFVKE